MIYFESLHKIEVTIGMRLVESSCAFVDGGHWSLEGQARGGKRPRRKPGKRTKCGNAGICSARNRNLPKFHHWQAPEAHVLSGSLERLLIFNALERQPKLFPDTYTVVALQTQRRDVTETAHSLDFDHNDWDSPCQWCSSQQCQDGIQMLHPHSRATSYCC
jgi:hypothetical protein